jgi:hypothetical protein
MIFNANSFVRSFKSPFILPLSLFMVSPFSAFRFHRFVLSRRTSRDRVRRKDVFVGRDRVRDTRSANTCPSSFLAELPRFDDSRNAK